MMSILLNRILIFIKSIIIIEIIIAIIQSYYREILFMIRNKCGNLIESFLYYKYTIDDIYKGASTIFIIITITISINRINIKLYYFLYK